MQTKHQEELPAQTGLCSIVSYPARSPLWGDGRYRGNCDGTLFKDLLLRYRPRRVADPMMGSGTTRDVVAWLKRTHHMNIDFWGGDLHQGFNLLSENLPGKFDFVWIHPPYWNIIRYSNHPDDLSNFSDYSIFQEALRLCLFRCYVALSPGGRLAALVGDIRRRGAYLPMVRDVLNLEGELGQLRSVIIKAQNHCHSDRVSYASMEDTPIRHEYCVIFKKVASMAAVARAA